MGLEPVEYPPGVEQRPLDHRVTLERRQSIVEALDRTVRRVPLGRDSYLVVAILAGETQLADYRFVLSPECPAQHTDVPTVSAAPIDRSGERVAWRENGPMVHGLSAEQG